MDLKKILSNYIACVWNFKFFLFIKKKVRNEQIQMILLYIGIPLGIIKHVFLSIRNMLSIKNKKFEDFLSLVIIVKNEALYLEEWIEYHKLLGIRKFYIYDNGSTDNTENVLKQYIHSGEVVYKKFPGNTMQCFAYNDAINQYKYKTKYMAFIDADEFIVIDQKKGNLKQILDSIFKKNKRIAGIGLHWRIFGSSNHVKRPEGLVIANYLYRAEDDFFVNSHIKTICNPRCCSGISNPHFPKYIIGHYCVDDLGRRVDGALQMPTSYHKIWINHYFTKSCEEWEEKIKRGKADRKDIREWKEFEGHDRNEIFDDRLNTYAKKLERRNNLKNR